MALLSARFQVPQDNPRTGVGNGATSGPLPPGDHLDTQTCFSLSVPVWCDLQGSGMATWAAAAAAALILMHEQAKEQAWVFRIGSQREGLTLLSLERERI